VTIVKKFLLGVGALAILEAVLIACACVWYAQ